MVSLGSIGALNVNFTNFPEESIPTTPADDVPTPMVVDSGPNSVRTPSPTAIPPSPFPVRTSSNPNPPQELTEDTYVGPMVDGQRHGEGLFYEAERKELFDGQFDRGEKVHGVLLNTVTTNMYNGEFKNGKKHGVGKLTIAETAEHREYTVGGVWKNGLLEGKAVIHFSNEKKGTAHFKNGVLNGVFKGECPRITLPNGKAAWDLFPCFKKSMFPEPGEKQVLKFRAVLHNGKVVHCKFLCDTN